MGSRELPGYCSFTKAIEHLSDRWSLLIVRQLGVGPQGFNELIRSLPGQISRSVLTERLRRLETLGLVSRGGDTGYRLTTVGAGLMPVHFSLRDWAETWLPDDPAMVERDPDVVLGWLAQRVHTRCLLDTGRYVYVRCSLATLLALARGRQDWPGALADGSLTTTGASDLSRRIPDWLAPR